MELEYIPKRRRAGLKKGRKQTVMGLDKLKPYALHMPPARDSLMGVTLSLFSWNTSP